MKNLIILFTFISLNLHSQECTQRWNIKGRSYEFVRNDTTHIMWDSVPLRQGGVREEFEICFDEDNLFCTIEDTEFMILKMDTLHNVPRYKIRLKLHFSSGNVHKGRIVEMWQINEPKWFKDEKYTKYQNGSGN